MDVRETEAAIDPRSVDWNGVVGVRYRIEQTLRYEYDRPIRNLRHQLMIEPRLRHLDQERLESRLWASPDVPLSRANDEFGNDVASLSVARVEREITFGLESTIVRSRSLAQAKHRTEAGLRQWFDLSRLTRPDEALHDHAAELRAAYPDPQERAQAIVAFVHASMIYTKNVTDVFTTASTAFHMRRGVCQDFSHIALALARASGLGARYASGHLIGEGATHAWVEFLIPRQSGFAVLSLDPTYRSATDFRYVVIAIGRDYGDVAPTSGVFTGKSSGKLHGAQRVLLMQLTYAA